MLRRVGLKRYEISNFSAVVMKLNIALNTKGNFWVSQGCESQHNLAYWKGSNYLGVGPGKVTYDILKMRWPEIAIDPHKHCQRCTFQVYSTPIATNATNLTLESHPRFNQAGQFIQSVSTLEPNAWMNKVYQRDWFGYLPCNDFVLGDS